ncbi:MAG TPA: efflux RND transporter periplasmic adaptor subunit [Chitinophagaceae bacterium]|nr:efflux RND transporter periplasmic adaptor subunit [Chitinophagaceae bacterium]
MKNVFILLLTGTVFLVLSSCGSKDKPSSAEELAKLKASQKEIQARIAEIEKQNGKNDSTRKVAVSVTPMTPVVFNNYIDVQGKVDIDEVVNAIPEMPGIIQNILVHEGQHVQKGQVVATLRSETIDRGIDQLDQQIAFAKTIYEKQKRLWDQEIGTELQLLTAKNNYDNLVNQKKTTLSNKNSFNVISPISGVVDAVNATVGQSYASPVNPPVIRIINTGRLKVKADIPENYAPVVHNGSSVQLIFPDVRDTLITKVNYVEKLINPLSRTFSAYIPLPSSARFQPNMTTQVKIASYQNARAFVLPMGVIQKTDKGDFVYVADASSHAVLKPVTLGNTYNSKVEILSGLTLGDHVITAGYEELNEGDLLLIEKGQ